VSLGDERPIDAIEGRDHIDGPAMKSTAAYLC
jgi:hypothetical protein